MQQPGKIARYAVTKTLGHGGYATVYLALDPKLEREVALKVAQQQSQDKQVKARFDREAKTVANLSHPAIVKIYDYDGDDPETGYAYLVMEYMRGGTLAKRLESQILRPDKAIEILERIAGALDYAHGEGIVHRDIKPANILFDEHDKAYLSDFGIVKLAGVHSALTEYAVIGTPQYISPEQLGSGEVDGRSDIYSLALVAFEMLIGNPPFSGTRQDLYEAHLVKLLPSVSHWNPTLPAECDLVLSKATEKQPERRYSTASEFVEALKVSLMAPRAYWAAEEHPEAVEQPDSTLRTIQALGEAGKKVLWQKRGFWLIPLLLVAVIAAVLFVLNRAEESRRIAAVVTAAPSQATQMVSTRTLTATATAMPTPQIIFVLDGSEGDLWQQGDNLARIPEDGRLPLTQNEEILLQSDPSPISLFLPNKGRLIIDGNATAVLLMRGILDTDVRLKNGRILVEGEQQRIFAGEQYVVEMLNGTVGVDFDEQTEMLQVDCLDGTCQVAERDEDAAVELATGQRVIVEGALDQVEMEPAQYGQYAMLLNGFPTLTPTSTPTNTAIPTVTGTATPSHTPTRTPIPAGVTTFAIGQSVQGRDLNITRLGSGERVILFVGGIHAGFAPNTVAVAEEMIKHFQQHPEMVPANVTLYVLPSLSPDSPLAPREIAGRLNANGVDLNRNWDCDWQPDATILGRTVAGAGGSGPLSEPETQALAAFIEAVQPAAVVFWTADDADFVSPGLCEDGDTSVSAVLTHYYGQAAGYRYIHETENIEVAPWLTGDVSNWLDAQGIPAFFTLLPGFEELDWLRERAGIEAVIGAVAADTMQVTPTPVVCPLAVAPQWSTVYEQYRGLLGCASGDVVEGSGVFQPFQGGLMIWRADNEMVYVLNDGDKFQAFPTADIPVPDFYVSDEIKGAIGYIWTTDQSVNQRLGPPEDVERAAADFQVQDFAKGTIFYFSDYGSKTYILIDSSEQWFDIE